MGIHIYIYNTHTVHVYACVTPIKLADNIIDSRPQGGSMAFDPSPIDD